VRTAALPRRDAPRPAARSQLRRPGGDDVTFGKWGKQGGPQLDLDVGAKYERDEASASNILSASITATVYPLGGAGAARAPRPSSVVRGSRKVRESSLWSAPFRVPARLMVEQPVHQHGRGGGDDPEARPPQ